MGEKEGEKKAADGGGKKDEGPVPVVLKLDLHCEGCAKKIRRAVGHFEGVEKVKADTAANKLSVTGNVDPASLRERVEYKTKKKVELISPQPKKDAAAGDKKPDDKSDKKEAEKKKDEKKKDEPLQPKKPAVSTVAMKIRLHCEGCARKIKRVISKNIDAVDSVKTDLEKDLVTVTGAMNVKELTAYLKEKLRRSVEIVPPKKDDGGGGDKKEKEGGGGEKKEKEGDGGDKKDGNKEGAGGSDKKKEGDGSSSKAAGEGTKVEVNKMEHHSLYPQTHYAVPYAAPPMYYNQSYANQDYGLQQHYLQPASHAGYAVQYGQGPPPPPPAYVNLNDQMFSDENPNGCSVM